MVNRAEINQTELSVVKAYVIDVPLAMPVETAIGGYLFLVKIVPHNENFSADMLDAPSREVFDESTFYDIDKAQQIAHELLESLNFTDISLYPDAISAARTIGSYREGSELRATHRLFIPAVVKRTTKPPGHVWLNQLELGQNLKWRKPVVHSRIVRHARSLGVPVETHMIGLSEIDPVDFVFEQVNPWDWSTEVAKRQAVHS